MPASDISHPEKKLQPEKRPTAKLFMHGRSQAVRLPKEFRFEGSEVRISKVGDKVILEPTERPPFDFKAWREDMRRLGSRDFLPEGRPEQPAWLEDDDVSLD